MLPEIERLLVLQLRDQTIAKLEADLKRIPHEKELAQSRLAKSQQVVADSKKALQENELTIKGVELDIETRKTTIGRLKTQQFETRKNEDFRSLGEEVERYQEEIDALETTELELMEQSDILRSTCSSAQEVLEKAQTSVQEDILAYEQREKEELARLNEAKEQRQQASSLIQDEDLLDLYQRLIDSRGNNAVVNLPENAQCSGCHVKVTPATLIKVQADKEINQCENCGRILYAG